MPLPRVSVIIVSWNALPLLKQCLPSVVQTDYANLEIILADNASTDGSSEWVAATYPDIRIIRHPDNWLFSRGNNVAMRQATGDYVVLLNNDVETPPGWLQPMVDAAIRDPNIAAVQPKILQYARRDHFDYAGAAGGFLDRLGYPFARGRIFDQLEADHGQYDDARDVDWGSGAALLLRRTALDEVGILDERFEMHMEEIDLCWRLRRCGFRIMIEPASHVFHIGGGSLPRQSTRKLYYNFRNNLLMLYKNLPPHQWWRIFAQRLVFDSAAVLLALLRGRPSEAAAILRAYRDAHRLKRFYRDKRPSTASPTALPSYRRSVILDHFLGRRKKYSDLPFRP